MESSDAKKDLFKLVEPIITTESDDDYLNQLIPIIRSAGRKNSYDLLTEVLTDIENNRDGEISRLCNTYDQDFVASVNGLLKAQETSSSLTSDILEFAERIKTSTTRLLDKKTELVHSKCMRANIRDTTAAVNDCVGVLSELLEIGELLETKESGKGEHYYAALRKLEYLQNFLLRKVKRYPLANLIETSVPKTQVAISEKINSGLFAWLLEMVTRSQMLGEMALYHSDCRNKQHLALVESGAFPADFTVNSQVGRAASERIQFNYLEQEGMPRVSFVPLLRAIHVHDALGKSKSFRNKYAEERQKQVNLIPNNPLDLTKSDPSDPSGAEPPDLRTLIENVAGYAVMEGFTMMYTGNFRPADEVETQWAFLAEKVTSLIRSKLADVRDEETLRAIQVYISQFLNAVEYWDYSIVVYRTLIVDLFNQFCVLKQDYAVNQLRNAINTDTYDELEVNSPAECDDVCRLTSYRLEDEQLRLAGFPKRLPFSSLLPGSYAAIRDMAAALAGYPDPGMDPAEVKKKVLVTADQMMSTIVCASMEKTLREGQSKAALNVFRNLSAFEKTCDAVFSSLVEEPEQVESVLKSLQSRARFGVGSNMAYQKILNDLSRTMNEVTGDLNYFWTPGSMEKSTISLPDILGLIDVSVSQIPVDLATKIRIELISNLSDRLHLLPARPEPTTITPSSTQAMEDDFKCLESYVALNQIPGDPLAKVRDMIQLLKDDPVSFLDQKAHQERYPNLSLEVRKVVTDRLLPAKYRRPTEPVRDKTPPKKVSVADRLGLGPRK